MSVSYSLLFELKLSPLVDSSEEKNFVELEGFTELPLLPWPGCITFSVQSNLDISLPLLTTISTKVREVGPS
jgi:hypothetical protein